MPTPEVGFGIKALDLARQLDKSFKEYVDSLARRRFERNGFNPRHLQVAN